MAREQSQGALFTRRERTQNRFPVSKPTRTPRVLMKLRAMRGLVRKIALRFSCQSPALPGFDIPRPSGPGPRPGDIAGKFLRNLSAYIGGIGFPL